MWRSAWWSRTSLVDRLTDLGPAHPLTARLEREGWAGLREDLEARRALAERFTRPGHAIRTCPACQGEGDGCPWCGGMGYQLITEVVSADDEVPLPREGWGRIYRRLRRLGRDEAASAADRIMWRRWRRAWENVWEGGDA